MRSERARGSSQFFRDAAQHNCPKGVGFMTPQERAIFAEKGRLSAKLSREKKKAADEDYPILGKERTKQLLKKLTDWDEET